MHGCMTLGPPGVSGAIFVVPMTYCNDCIEDNHCKIIYARKCKEKLQGRLRLRFELGTKSVTHSFLIGSLKPI